MLRLLNFRCSFCSNPLDETHDGLPVTKPERTLVDLCLDFEDPSLIIDAYNDALGRGLDIQRLKALVEENSKTAKRRELMAPLLIALGCD